MWIAFSLIEVCKEKEKIEKDLEVNIRCKIFSLFDVCLTTAYDMIEAGIMNTGVDDIMKNQFKLLAVEQYQRDYSHFNRQWNGLLQAPSYNLRHRSWLGLAELYYAKPAGVCEEILIDSDTFWSTFFKKSVSTFVNARTKKLYEIGARSVLVNYMEFPRGDRNEYDAEKLRRNFFVQILSTMQICSNILKNQISYTKNDSTFFNFHFPWSTTRTHQSTKPIARIGNTMYLVIRNSLITLT